MELRRKVDDTTGTAAAYAAPAARRSRRATRTRSPSTTASSAKASSRSYGQAFAAHCLDLDRRFPRLPFARNNRVNLYIGLEGINLYWRQVIMAAPPMKPFSVKRLKINTIGPFVRKSKCSATKARSFLAGEITENDFRPFRLKHGIYGQRQAGVQMVRCKIPGGLLTSARPSSSPASPTNSAAAKATSPPARTCSITSSRSRRSPT